MVKTTSSEIADYIFKKLAVRGTPGYVHLSDDGSIIFNIATRTRIGKAVVTPKYVEEPSGRGRVEISVDSSRLGANYRDFDYFLEKLVDEDTLFHSGAIFPKEEVRKELHKWAGTLERVHGKKGEREIMVCRIVNPDVSPRKLKAFIYDYMMRPILYYLSRAGSFSSSA